MNKMTQKDMVSDYLKKCGYIETSVVIIKEKQLVDIYGNSSKKGMCNMDINELSGWGISQQIAQIVENGFTFDEETGEVFFTTDDLDALNEALDNKLESLAGIYQMYGSKADALKARSKEIAERAKSFENKADKLKKYIDSLMQANNKEKLEVGDKKLSYRKSMAGNIIDDSALRQYINSKDEYKQKYFSYKEPEIAKKNLKDDILASKQEDGSYSLVIPGFEVVENKNLLIK